MTEDDTLSRMVSADLLARLNALAERADRPVADCVRQAIAEFCETWEDYHKTMDSIILNEDERRSLRVVND